MTDYTYNQLANAFSKMISAWLTDEEFAEMIKRNKAETNDSICHSHDFCDANMAMFEILEDFFGEHYQSKSEIPDDKAEYTAFFSAFVAEGNKAIQNAETTPLMTAWSEAWEIAKRNEFKTVDQVNRTYLGRKIKRWDIKVHITTQKA